jgi:phosphatidylinositol alpha-1,6-mannosyltransferase
MSAKRVLLISRNFPPLIGGMERLILHVAIELSVVYEVDLIGPPGSERFLPGRGRACPSLSSRLSIFLISALWQVLRTRMTRSYAVAVAGSGVTAPLALIAAWLHGGRAVVYLHGLDLVSDSFLYQRIFFPFVRHSDLVLVNSRNTAALAEKRGVPRERIQILHPGVAPPVMAAAGCGFMQDHGLEKRPILLSVGRLVPRKGLLEFVRNCMPDIVAAVPGTVLFVVGAEPTDALSKQHRNSVDLIAEMSRLGLSDNLCMAGRISDEALSATYRDADLHVFPAREVDGDVEGFGMVALEAAAHGLPTIAFSVGGITDAVADGRSGFLVSADDYAAMSSRIIRLLQSGRDPALAQSCRDFAAGYAWPVFGAALRAKFAGIVR